MKKSINLLIGTVLTLIFSVSIYIVDSYSFEKDNLELLILNNKYRKELKREIENINNISKCNSDDQECIKVSSSEKNLNYDTYKELLLRNLEESAIEEAKLEKIIQQEKQIEIKENNLEFIKGQWPVKEYEEVSSPYGYRVHPITSSLKFHRGVDIPAPENTDILSSDDGVVIFSGVQNGYGNVVKIKHFDGKVTIYAHNFINIVEEEDVVRKGELIAKVGSTGDSTGNHVHFEMIVNDKNIDPITGIEDI